jgi:hypothetical protein
MTTLLCPDDPDTQRRIPCVPGSASELVANTETDLPRRLELCEARTAWIPEVGVHIGKLGCVSGS